MRRTGCAAGRTRSARRCAGSALPVLEGALERSLALAAAMDSRGYGGVRRPAAVARASRQRTSSAGCSACCVGVYGLLDAGTAGCSALPLLAGGIALAVAGLALAGRRSVRTRYRPDPWRAPEWLVAASGLVPAVVVVAVSVADPVTLVDSTSPLAWPALPLLAALAVLVALVPGVAAPLPPGRPVHEARPARPEPASVAA